MPPHMREHKIARATGFSLCLQIVKIDTVIIGDIYQYRHRTTVVDSAGNRRQGKGVTEYFVPGFNTGSRIAT